MQLRPTTSQDRDLLERLLVEAFNWNGQTRVTLEEIRTDPRYAHHLHGWQRLRHRALELIIGQALGQTSSPAVAVLVAVLPDPARSRGRANHPRTALTCGNVHERALPTPR